MAFGPGNRSILGLGFTVIVGIVLGLFPFLVCGELGEDLSLRFQGPGHCNLSHNETFSWAELGCVRCQWKQEDLPDYCPCPSNTGHIEKYVPGSNGGKCSKCPEGMMLYDKRHCIGCGSLNPFSMTLDRCQPCPQGHIEVAYEMDGSIKEQLQCAKCADGYHPAPSGRQCISCHRSFPSARMENGTCRCPEVSHSLYGGICFSSQELTEGSFDTKTLYRIEYDGHKAESHLFREKLMASFYLCKGKNQTACQMLANMCALNLYSFSESEWNACYMYRRAVPGDPPSHAPKIYYRDGEAPSILARASSIPQTHDTQYSQPSSDVNITVSKFSFTGEFLGLAAIEDVIPCRKSKTVLRAARKFGTNFKTECPVVLRDLWNEHKDKMAFLDPYVSYEDYKGKEKRLKLFQVPIQILNFKRNGQKVNTMEDRYSWQFVRRFFVIDTIGSVDSKDGKSEPVVPKTLRYLKRLHINIQLQNSKDAGKIYVPLLTLEYTDVSPDQTLDEIITFEYAVTYGMDMSRSLEDVKITLGVLCALTVLWSAIQTWSWNRRNGQLEIDLTTISNLIVTACGNLADIFFLVCFSTALFWWAFFKQQAAVHVFLPDIYQERLVRDLMISAFALKIVAIIKLIWHQATIDIFFVDWERPKVRNSIQTISQQQKSHDAEQIEKHGINPDDSVSIWRTYFIANEWNEIQTTRKVHMALQIVATLFFLEVLDFKLWGLHWPVGTLDNDPEVVVNVPYSTSARFVVTTIIFGLLGIIQWMFRVGIYDRYITNDIQDFVDLCTMGNISVIILAGRQHGYYIHGRSVHGFADTDMQTMIEQLHREEEDLCGRRGLLPQTDQQTFLISVPNTFRSVYNQVLQPLYASSTATSVILKGRHSGGGKSSTITGTGPSKPSANVLNLSIHAYHSMNKFLTAFLEHALSDMDYDITDKTFFEKLLDMEFNEVGSDRAVFYTDDGHSFDSVLFYGHERTLFLFNLYIFVFVDILSHNYILAGIVVYIVDCIVKIIRNNLGKRNLARKTLIDSRFLI